MLNTPPKPSTLKARAVAPWECELPSFYRVHPCGSQNVTDALRDEISYWEPRNPIFISAPTGRGKSHFFKTVLLPDALARNRTMLIIGNRIALSMQQKMELLELLDSPLRSYLTDEGLRNTECFGSVAVITYHRLPAFLSNPENAVFLSKLLYVASDEVHLLTTDSAFNSNTDYYLKLLTTRFQSAIRVYLTATPSDVLYPLAQAEHENWGRKEVFVNYYLPPRSFQLYRFDASYAHIRLDFVQRLEDLKCQIDASSEEKWLVFCDSKESGRAFADSLNVSHQYLDADSKSSAEWTALLKKQRFDCRVMVCTKAIDTGINIHDPKLKHVAVVTDDHTTFLQMIGRKRCAPGESIPSMWWSFPGRSWASGHSGPRSCWSFWRNTKPLMPQPRGVWLHASGMRRTRRRERTSTSSAASCIPMTWLSTSSGGSTDSMSSSRTTKSPLPMPCAAGWARSLNVLLSRA